MLGDIVHRDSRPPPMSIPRSSHNSEFLHRSSALTKPCRLLARTKQTCRKPNYKLAPSRKKKRRNKKLEFTLRLQCPQTKSMSWSLFPNAMRKTCWKTIGTSVKISTYH